MIDEATVLTAHAQRELVIVKKMSKRSAAAMLEGAGAVAGAVASKLARGDGAASTEDEDILAMFAAMTPRARDRLLASWRASQRAARAPPSCLRDLRGATYPHGEGFDKEILKRFNNTQRGKESGCVSFFTAHKANALVVKLFEHLAEVEGKSYNDLRHELVVGTHTAKGKEKLQNVGDGAETVGFNVYVNDHGRLQLCSGGGDIFTPSTLKAALRDELKAESPNKPLVALIQCSVYRGFDPALLIDAILKGDPEDLEVTAWSARTGAPFDVVLSTRGETGGGAISLFGGEGTVRLGTTHLVSQLRLRGGSGGGGGGGGEVDVDNQLDCLLAWLGLIFAAFWSMHPQSPGNGGVGITRAFEPEVVGASGGAAGGFDAVANKLREAGKNEDEIKEDLEGRRVKKADAGAMFCLREGARVDVQLVNAGGDVVHSIDNVMLQGNGRSLMPCCKFKRTTFKELGLGHFFDIKKTDKVTSYFTDKSSQYYVALQPDDVAVGGVIAFNPGSKLESIAAIKALQALRSTGDDNKPAMMGTTLRFVLRSHAPKPAATTAEGADEAAADAQVGEVG